VARNDGTRIGTIYLPFAYPICYGSSPPGAGIQICSVPWNTRPSCARDVAKTRRATFLCSDWPVHVLLRTLLAYRKSAPFRPRSMVTLPEAGERIGKARRGRLQAKTRPVGSPLVALDGGSSAAGARSGGLPGERVRHRSMASQHRDGFGSVSEAFWRCSQLLHGALRIVHGDRGPSTEGWRWRSSREEPRRMYDGVHDRN
jgi:hypothetical protein